MIETEHCLLRPLAATDEELVFRLDSQPEIVQYISEPFSQQASAAHLQQMLMYNKFYNHQLGFWVVMDKISQQAMGWFTLKHLDLTQEIELGARLLPEYWNRGCATEVASALIAYAKGLGLKELASVTHPDNIAPQRVLKRLGFYFSKKAIFYNQTVHYFYLSL